MFKKIAWGLALLPSLSWAGEALIMGQGEVLSTPDYVELGINVESKCYSTPDEARKYNDEAAAKIVEFLNKKISGGGFYNKVISEGGYTQPFSIYQRDKVLCENTFQKTNTIRLRTQNVDHFDALFDAIQKEVYQQFKSQPRGMVESSVTYVTMNAPSPQISSERQQTLERQAMTQALSDAKAKLQSMFGDHPIQNLKLVEISEIRPENPRPMPVAQMRMMAMSDSAEVAAAPPVQFDDQWIRKTIYFRFNFDDVTLP